MNKKRGVTYLRRWATARSFRNMEMLEFEKEEENNAPIYIDIADFYDNTDLFCEDDDKEDIDFWLSCDRNPIAHLVQPCEQMICTNCAKKNNSIMGIANIQYHND